MPFYHLFVALTGPALGRPCLRDDVGAVVYHFFRLALWVDIPGWW